MVLYNGSRYFLVIYYTTLGLSSRVVPKISSIQKYGLGVTMGIIFKNVHKSQFEFVKL